MNEDKGWQSLDEVVQPIVASIPETKKENIGKKKDLDPGWLLATSAHRRRVK